MMHLPLIALICAVVLGSLAIVAMKFTARLKGQPALATDPVRRLTRSVEGSLVLPVRGPAAKQELAAALDHQVDDTIRRLILMN